MTGRSPSTSTNAEVISYNDDLLLAILILLPAKSLIRFKSVSKHWRFLISDASFRLLHTRRHRSPQTSFLLAVSLSQFYHFNPTSKNFVPFNFNFDDAIIRQSCNGLFLVQTHPDRVYYVYNPTTGETRNLLLKENYVSGVFLAFDPWKSPHYKVFCVRYAKPLLVYDSETHTWNPDERIYSVHPPLRKGVYSNNFIYSQKLSREGTLFWFDIENLVFRSPFEEDFTQRALSVSCILESFGHVHCVANYYATNRLVVDEMTVENGKLSFKHLFDFNITPWCPRITPWNIFFLGIIRGDGIDDTLVFHIPGKIMAFHFFEGRFEELLDCSAQEFYKDNMLQFAYESCQFVESLAPV